MHDLGRRLPNEALPRAGHMRLVKIASLKNRIQNWIALQQEGSGAQGPLDLLDTFLRQPGGDQEMILEGARR